MVYLFNLYLLFPLGMYAFKFLEMEMQNQKIYAFLRILVHIVKSSPWKVVVVYNSIGMFENIVSP